MIKIIEDILKQRVALNDTLDMRRYKYILQLTMGNWYKLMSSKEALQHISYKEEDVYFQDMLIEPIPKGKIKIVVHEKDGSTAIRYEEVLTVVRGDLDG